MVSAFTVPGTVTYQQVVRPAADETTAQRIHRLAQKAVIEGCRTLRLYGSGHFVVTSGTDAMTAYDVDRSCQTCTCQGFSRHGICKHLAVVLAELGELPFDPEPPTPAAPNLPASITMDIACEACCGSGADAVKDRNGDWRDINCPVCRGYGRRQIDVPADDLEALDALDDHTLRGQVCSICHGDGAVRVHAGDRLSDWTVVTCHACGGIGLVPVPYAGKSADLITFPVNASAIAA